MSLETIAGRTVGREPGLARIGDALVEAERELDERGSHRARDELRRAGRRPDPA